MRIVLWSVPVFTGAVGGENTGMWQLASSNKNSELHMRLLF